MKRKDVSLATGIALLVLVLNTMTLGVLWSEFRIEVFQFHRFSAFTTVALAIFHAAYNLKPYFGRPKRRAEHRTGLQ